MRMWDTQKNIISDKYKWAIHVGYLLFIQCYYASCLIWDVWN